MHIRLHERLIVWKESYKLCLWIYFLTQKFPKEERYCLTSQMRRASTSIPTNIAEGNMKQSAKERAHFMEIASASLEELHVEVMLANDLGYVQKSDFMKAMDLINRTSYLLMKFRASIKRWSSSASSASSDSSVS